MYQMNKNALRALYLKKRKETDEEALSLWSAEIEKHLKTFIEKKSFTVVMAYASFRGEPDTFGLIGWLLSTGRRVGLPKCRHDGSMEMFELFDTADLKPGKFGILEPPENSLIRPCEAELVLVPGCAFGRNMHRIGYGKGYYDRYLPCLTKAVKAGVCYDFCLTDTVPAEAFDVKMDLLVTENGVMNKL